MTPTHRAVQHPTGRAGIEARSYLSDRAFPRHSHDQFGIGVMLAGGQRSWSCIGEVEGGAGDIVMVNPGEVHDGMPVRAASRSWLTLYLDPGLVADELAEEGLADPEVRPIARDPRLAGRILALFRGLTGDDDPLAVDEGLVQVLVETVRRHGLRPPGRLAAPPAIDRVRRRIDEAPERPASLAELATLAGTSRFQLLRAFARTTGMTPHAYLMQRRLGLARRLLASGEAPAAASLAAGFADQSHLTRAFARQFGVTPGRYRAALAA